MLKIAYEKCLPATGFSIFLKIIYIITNHIKIIDT